jgi:signal transduction histidine kinase
VELAFQNHEKEKRAEELSIANGELKEAEESLKDYIGGLEEMMFITSHKVRQPVANILGIANILDECINSPIQLKRLVEHLQQSALTLDVFTKELTLFISDLDQKGKK